MTNNRPGPLTPQMTPGTASQARVVESVLRARRTCRAFRADPIPQKLIEEILETSQRSASWCNVQPWEVAVTSGPGTERLRTALYDSVVAGDAGGFDVPAPARYLGKYDERRRQSGHALYESLGIARSDRQARRDQALENFRFFGAPHVMVIHSDAELGPYGLVDCGGYIATFLLVAHAFGVATAPQAALAMQSRVLHEQLDIPEGRVIVAGISFGYSADNPVNEFRTPRAPLADVVTWVNS